MPSRRKKPKDWLPAVNGARLRDARERLGWRQWDLCVKAGLHPSELSEYESDQREMLASTLLRLCKALGKDPNSLLRWDKPGK